MADHPPSRKLSRKSVFPMTKLERYLLISGAMTYSGWMSRRPRSLTPIHLPTPRPNTESSFIVD